ncbi:MAG: phosphate acyltransferase PlsX [Chloroflexota bacterium]|nr:phosphate acyltransferase PlsX [Chloroflexota bacterium]
MQSFDSPSLNTGDPIRVAVDAMGGDYAPQETVKGALAALDTHNMELLLVGDSQAVEGELDKYGPPSKSVKVVPSVDKISDEEHPMHAFRQKPEASIIVGARLVKAGQADVLVSLGSTGASMATSALVLGMMDGLERPCIGGPFLGLAPRTVLMDLGSNVDCRPSQLLNFAALGSVFAHRFLGTENPRVALLSVGAEKSKGNRQVQESYQLFESSHLNFVGNVEGMDFFGDKADVIVCDGFVGNILIKFTEGMGTALGGYLGRLLSPYMSEEQMKGVFNELWQTTNLPRTMGGPLFGVNGAVIVGHGSSRADGVSGAINTAVRYVEMGLLESMREELAEVSRNGLLGDSQ